MGGNLLLFTLLCCRPSAASLDDQAQVPHQAPQHKKKAEAHKHKVNDSKCSERAGYVFPRKLRLMVIGAKRQMTLFPTSLPLAQLNRKAGLYLKSSVESTLP